MTVYLGPFGYLFELRGPEPAVPTNPNRANSEQIRMDGAVGVVQRAQRAPRAWELSWPFLDDADAAVLIGLEQGVYGTGPLWFYDPFAARANMLTPAVATPGIAGDWSAVPLVAGDVEAGAGWVLPAGPPVRTAVNLTVPLSVGVDSSTPVPVRPGWVYTASAYTDHASGTCAVGLAWVDDGGVLVGTSTGATVAAGQHRPYITAAAPSTAAGVFVTVQFSVAGSATALQLNEGSLRDWFPGRGIPRVSVTGLDEVYELLRADTEERSFTATLREVG